MEADVGGRLHPFPARGPKGTFPAWDEVKGAFVAWDAGKAPFSSARNENRTGPKRAPNIPLLH